MARGIEEITDEEDDGIVKTNAKEVHWKVPKGTKKVMLFKYSKDGKYESQYNISSYITMEAGETFIIKAKE